MLKLKKLTKELIEKIGFYKYENSNKLVVECVREYPITADIINYITQKKDIKFEFENNEPKLIDGKFVVLI